MRPDQQLHLAHLVKRQRERLEEVVTELAKRGEPISELEARLLVEAGNARLTHVEDALRHDARQRLRRRNRTLAHLIRRVQSWTKPRIGILRHYHAKPLQVPARYARVTPPAAPPTISIVTPSFQQGRYIDRAIYSVVSQEYPALEYVVQDGGSSDETVDVLRRFAPLLARWVSEPDSGQAEAINRGFAQTSGEIMAWLNSDDLLLPGSLAAVARYFASHPEVDVVYGNRLMIDETDGQIGAWILPRHDNEALTLADYVPQETLFWRRRMWDAIGASVDTRFRFAVDWDLLLRFRAAGAKIVHVPRFLGAFRVHPEQKTFIDRRVGQTECEQLRKRVHGRSISSDEVYEGLQRYFARHVRAHNRQRLMDRLPLARIAVQTLPKEPELKRPKAELRKARVHVLGADEPETVSPLAPPADLLPDLGDSREDEQHVAAARRTVGG